METVIGKTGNVKQRKSLDLDIGFRVACRVTYSTESHLLKIREFSFSTTGGSATVFQPTVVVFSTTKIHPIPSIIVEIEGRPSSKPTQAEPSVVVNEKSLISRTRRLNFKDKLGQTNTHHCLPTLEIEDFSVSSNCLTL